MKLYSFSSIYIVFENATFICYLITFLCPYNLFIIYGCINKYPRVFLGCQTRPCVPIQDSQGKWGGLHLLQI